MSRKDKIEAAHLPIALQKSFKYLPSADGKDSNLLILFHGLGDNEEPYYKLAERMKLPQTACLALRAPLEMPLELGYSWFFAPLRVEGIEDLIPQPSPMQVQVSLNQLTEILSQLLKNLSKLKWEPSRVFCLGFSQGCIPALLLSSICSSSRLGGVVCVCPSGLEPLFEFLKRKRTSLSEPDAIAAAKNTPQLWCLGSKDATSPLTKCRQWKSTFEEIIGKITDFKEAVFDKGHVMINSQPEALAVMQFFASHLYLGSGVEHLGDDVIPLGPRGAAASSSSSK